MFPEPTELVGLDWLFDRIILDPKIKSNTLTPRTNSQTYWQREISHVMNGIIFCVCSTLAISVLQIAVKWCQNERKKNAGEERVTAKSKPMMNLVSRCSVRNPDVLAFIASESQVKTRFESQIPLSSWTEQHPRTGRPVMYACSSNYSEWNTDEKWSSQEWKFDEVLEARTERLVMYACSSNYSEWNTDEKWSSQEWKFDEVLEARTERLVSEQPAGLYTHHTDSFASQNQTFR